MQTVMRWICQICDKKAWYYNSYRSRNGWNASFFQKNSKIVGLKNYWSSKQKTHRMGSGTKSFPKDNLTQSKKYNSPIECNNGRQRHWLATFIRRSIVVTRSLENLAISIVLFARFHINRSIDELITLLKWNSLMNTEGDRSCIFAES